MGFGALLVSCSNSTESGEAEDSSSDMSFIDRSNLDTTVRAQDDFFNYANGTWMANNEIPGSKSSWGSFNILIEENQKKLKSIAENAAGTEAEEGSIKRKVGDFWKSAMDSMKVEEAGLSPIQEKIDAIDNISSTEELLAYSAELRSETVSNMFSLYIGQDDKNPEEYILHLSQGGLGLPSKDYYLRSDERSTNIQNEYIAHLGNMLAFLGYEDTEARAQGIFDLEKSLAEGSKSRVELRDTEANYNKFSLSEFDAEISNINFESYINTLEINGVENVLVGQPEFFNVLNNSLDNHSLDTWKDYLKWNVISDAASFLNHDIAKERFRFYSTVLRGVQEMEPRWKRSLGYLNSVMGDAIGQMYVEEYFPPAAKETALEMINDIQTAFAERIKNLDWMSPETKEAALEKLSTFTKKIGYPEEWKDYSSLNISPDNFYQNMLAGSILEQRRDYDKLGKEIDRNEWFMTPPTVNAYYNPTMNEIVFPAGILQFPFFHPDADAAINYGGMGAVIGHELTHGFDDQGSKYDASGKLNTWWQNEDTTRFMAKTKVLQDQYSEFTVLDTVHLDGKLTLGENIADLGGLTIAYDALQKYYERHGKPEEIDGFTAEQRFFMSWAQVWRIKMRDEALFQRVMTDPHSPGYYRVNGVVSNMPEFYEAFGVKEGDAHYRAEGDRAKIW